MKTAPSHVYIFNLLYCILNYSTLVCLCTFLLKGNTYTESCAYLFYYVFQTSNTNKIPLNSIN